MLKVIDPKDVPEVIVGILIALVNAEDYV